MGHMGWSWVGSGCGGRGPHARVCEAAGSVVPRLAVGCVRVWRRGGVAAACRVCPSRVLGGCGAADRGWCGWRRWDVRRDCVARAAEA